MPTLNWIGKDAVIRHHKDVPSRLLEVDAELSHGEETGNLIVQGDNLHALKALLPKFAGKVKCIYIDPPYNTGNEGWVYNDKVNAPEMKKWLGEVVGKEAEDLSRHDKWLCMMYPRLVLLKQFLTEDGAIFVSIDDNEVATLRLVMDEIFGRGNFLTDIVWRHSDNSNNNALKFSEDFTHTLVFTIKPDWRPNYLNDLKKRTHFKNPDNDLRGAWFDGNPVNNPGLRENLQFNVTTPSGKTIKHPPNGWRWSQDTIKKKLETGEMRFSEDETRLIRRTYLEEADGLPPSNLWIDLEQTSHTRRAKYDLKNIFPEIAPTSLFATPKAVNFLKTILEIATDKDSIILDSFAGSGTTGHAVLKQNAEDGGNRRFILVEMEEKIAQGITAERVRRVAGGYRNAKGDAVAGLGGGFQFCRLSAEPLFNEFGDVREDVSFGQLADFVWFAETGEGYLGEAKSALLGVKDGTAVYLLFNGILGDLRPEAGNVLTVAVLDSLPSHEEGPRIIYAAACKIGEAERGRRNVIFKQTPYAIEV